MDSSASRKRKIRKKDIIFHDNANKQTQSCVLILKIAVKFVLEIFLNENVIIKIKKKYLSDR